MNSESTSNAGDPEAMNAEPITGDKDEKKKEELPTSNNEEHTAEEKKEAEEDDVDPLDAFMQGAAFCARWWCIVLLRGYVRYRG